MMVLYVRWGDYMAGKLGRGVVSHKLNLVNSKYIIGIFHRFDRLMRK
jgi:hypothetical protein